MIASASPPPWSHHAPTSRAQSPRTGSTGSDHDRWRSGHRPARTDRPTQIIYRASILDTRRPVPRRPGGRPWPPRRTAACWSTRRRDRRPRTVRGGACRASRTRHDRDLRGGVLLPGFVDTHVHYPQVRAIGGLGMPLLDWLDRCALPEEMKLADRTYAKAVAAEFLPALVSRRDHERVGLRGPLRPRDGCAVRGGRPDPGCGSPADWCSATGCCREPLLTTADAALAESTRADRALARPRPAALRGDAAVRAVGVGGDARGVPGAAGRRRHVVHHATSTRTARRSTRSRRSSRTAGTTSTPTPTTVWSATAASSRTTSTRPSTSWR